MKILKILGIAAGIHALALIVIFANPGCSYTKAAPADASPITAAPDGSGPPPPAITSAPDATVGIRYSPTRPGTPVASALETQPVADVTPATTYTVGHGDSLWSIAKKNNLTRAELAAANNLKATATLHVGQKLVIPSKAPGHAEAEAAASKPSAEPPAAEKPAGPAPAAADSVRHTVKAGETLGGIARKYGVRQGDIAVANNITDPRKIHPGQELVIPAKAAGSRAPKAAKATDAARPAPAPAAKPDDQDLDVGLKPASSTDVPAVKIDDSAQPKNL